MKLLLSLVFLFWASAGDAGIDLRSSPTHSVVKQLDEYLNRFKAQVLDNNINAKELGIWFKELEGICQKTTPIGNGHENRLAPWEARHEEGNLYNVVDDKVYQKMVMVFAWVRRGRVDIARKEYEEAKKNLEAIGAVVQATSIPVKESK